VYKRQAQDKILSEKFEKQLEEDLSTLLMPAFEPLYEANAYIYIAKGRFPTDQTLDQAIIREASISFGLSGAEINQDAFITLCDQIRNTILEEGIEPKYLRFDYNLRVPNGKGNIGALQYTLELEEEQIRLPAADFEKEAELYAFNNSGKDPALMIGYRITGILWPLGLLGLIGTFIVSGVVTFIKKPEKQEQKS
jgi:hypothetical protein